jgi:hypothetical protein
MGTVRNKHNILGGNPEGKTTPGRSERKSKYMPNMKTHQDANIGGWIHLAQDRISGRFV